MHIPNINFTTEEEFIDQMYENAHDINVRMLIAIEMAMLIYDYEPVIAYLNDDYELRLEHTEWINNLERTLEYFEGTEEYDKCIETVTLLKKVKTFLGKDLVN